MKRRLGRYIWIASDAFDHALDVVEDAAPSFVGSRLDVYLSKACIGLAMCAVRLGYDGRSGRHARGEA